MKPVSNREEYADYVARKLQVCDAILGVLQEQSPIKVDKLNGRLFESTRLSRADVAAGVSSLVGDGLVERGLGSEFLTISLVPESSQH